VAALVRRRNRQIIIADLRTRSGADKPTVAEVMRIQV
jgi:hypothetical protein